MIIKKYLHSCLLIEESGKRLLIDPGNFSFVEKKITPADIGPVDVIVYTHKHLDHYDPAVLKELMSLHKAVLVTNKEIAELLVKDGFSSELIHEGETKTFEGFTVNALTAPHGPIPAEIPHNLAIIVNKTLLHPGDSLEVENLPDVPVLALPIAAPWLRAVDSIAFAKDIRPKHVIPIHDAIIKDFMLERMYGGMFGPKLEKEGIAFHPLNLHEKFET